MVLVTDNKVVKNHVIYMENAPNEDTLNKLSKLVNDNLRNYSLEDFDSELIMSLASQAGPLYDAVITVLRAVMDVIQTEDDIQVYTTGIKNILSFPEFSDLEKAKAMFYALEQKDLLLTLLEHNNTDKIQVIIGSENQLSLLTDCSVIKANYHVGGQSFGAIGIIGPKRMDYSQAVSILSSIIKHINAVIKALSGG
jgi:heat-inducible transcriptional repressor